MYRLTPPMMSGYDELDDDGSSKAAIEALFQLFSSLDFL